MKWVLFKTILTLLIQGPLTISQNIQLTLGVPRKPSHSEKNPEEHKCRQAFFRQISCWLFTPSLLSWCLNTAEQYNSWMQSTSSTRTMLKMPSPGLYNRPTDSDYQLWAPKIWLLIRLLGAAEALASGPLQHPDKSFVLSGFQSSLGFLNVYPCSVALRTPRRWHKSPAPLSLFLLWEPAFLCL